MQCLVILRGSPGSGKSTWIKNHGLEEYTLSADEIRLQFQSPVMTVPGKLGISQRNDGKVWEFLFKILEDRMMRGEFTVIDATHSRSSDFSKYKKLLEKYRYRLYCVDFSDVPIEVSKERNKSRNEYKLVPEPVIENIYARMKVMNVPKYVTVIKPDEFDDVLQYKSVDYSKYKCIHHIGDIHGCYTVLMKYFEDNPFNDDDLYIFLGDYVDRGIENGKVIKFIIEIMNKTNVILLRGNHELWLNKWATDTYIENRKFVRYTQPDMENEGITKSDVRQLFRKLSQCVLYTYHGKTVLVNHGGLSTLPENLLYTATDQLIYGVGKHQEMLDICRIFTENTPDNVYQVFGHRNNDDDLIVQERCRNVCDHIEFGGHLRVWDLYPDHEKCIYIKNPVYNRNIRKNMSQSDVKSSVGELIKDLEENNKYVHKKHCSDSIYSYSFNRAAFLKDIWPGCPRGLFIDSVNEKIVARGYNKFYNIGQKETEMKFPASAYVKYNGFLGLVGYDHEHENLFISSKTSPNSDHTKWFTDILFSDIIDYDSFLYDLKFNNLTAVFECIDPINDPHIIEYSQKRVVLLDLIYNTTEFKKMPYSELIMFALKHGLEVKKKAYSFKNKDEFKAWYAEITTAGWKYKGEYIEGFVVEDSNGLMTKVKLDYYKFWKSMRGLTSTVKNGRVVNFAKLFEARMNEFYGFLLKTYKQNPELLDKSIISLRKDFLIN